MQPHALLRSLAISLTLFACSSSGGENATGSPPDTPYGDRDPSQPAASGPVIACDRPGDGGMLDAALGSNVAFGGSVGGPNGVATVIVNGAAATVLDNRFSANITSRFGINFAAWSKVVSPRSSMCRP